ncbi:M14 family zinc carboxypeptidase [Poriferisphaera sp. WC338]|uniref:M14 family zinc carboxypeptidase n=1 Tax=Poriferisphaera sp. WC338 TaxID=3425129 RepID=UPI003D81C31E
MRRNALPYLFLTVITTFSLATTNLSAQITFDANFDHGSLKFGFVSGISGDYILQGRNNYFSSNEWRWLNFKVSGVQNLTPNFWISDDFAGGSSRLNDHQMVYSYDQNNWFYFDNNGRDGSGGYEFSNNTNFTQDNVYVAYAFPYSYGRAAQHTASIKNNPYVHATNSSNSNLIIGQSPGGIDDIGRTIAPRDMFGYKITDTSSSAPKKKIVLASGLHANEVLGNHTLEGMIDFLLSDDPRMQTLRKHAEFFVYPMLNPDGRFAGLNRSTVENIDEDPNRDWNPDNYDAHEDIRVSGDAMIADTGSDVDYFIDFHSTIPTGAQADFGFIEYEKGHRDDPFWIALTALEPDLKSTDSSSTGWTSANFGDWQLGAEFDMTFETMFGLNRDQSYYTELGESFALAFADALNPMPEPTSIMLLGLGGLLLNRRRA